MYKRQAIGLFNYLINKYVIKKEKGKTGITPLLGKYYKIRALIGFLTWVIAGFVAFALPNIARFLFVFIFIFEYFLAKRFEKKLAQE